MRTVLISGIALAAIGLYLLLKGASYSREESVFKIGGLEAKVQQQHRVPEWVGGVALGAGGVLIGLALWKRATSKR